MELSLFLTKIMGAYLIIVSIAVLTKGKFFHKMMKEFEDSRFMQYFVGIFCLILGLLIVGSHNLWVMPLNVLLITIFGWLVLLKGVFFLLLPKKPFKKFIEFFDSQTWYIIAGIIYLVIGIYFIYTWFTAVS